MPVHTEECGVDVRAAQCPQTHRIVELVYQVFNSLDQKGSVFFVFV